MVQLRSRRHVIGNLRQGSFRANQTYNPESSFTATKMLWDCEARFNGEYVHATGLLHALKIVSCNMH